MSRTNVLIQDANGLWAQVGTGLLRGLKPTDVELTADAWGPKTASFTLVREAGIPWPDVAAYAPVEIYVDGVMEWDGRIIEAPANDQARTMSVQCEGWQHHLDDDQFQRNFVHTDIGQWTDIRGLPGIPLANFTTPGVVEAGNGIIKIGWTQGELWPASQGTAVVLDLGLSYANNPTQNALTFQYRKLGGGNSTEYLYARAFTDPSKIFTEYVDILASPLQVSAMSTTAATSVRQWGGTLPWRYVALFVWNTSDYTVNPADKNGDCVVIDSVKVFTDQDFQNGTTGASELRGDEVVSVALDGTVPRLDADRTGVESTGTAFYIPEFWAEAPRTPRQAIEAVNPFFDYRAQVQVGRRFVFEDRSADEPVATLGNWGASFFDDASNASAKDVVNKVIVAGSGPDGRPVQSIRHSRDIASLPETLLASPAFNNGNFESGVTGWTTDGSSTFTQATTPKYGTYAGLWAGPGSTGLLAGHELNAQLDGVFEAGYTYTVHWWVRATLLSGAGTSTTLDYVQFGDQATDDLTSQYMSLTSGTVGTYYEKTITWTPKADTANATLRLAFINAAGGAWNLRIDAATIMRDASTVVNRRGFSKAYTLDADFMLTQTSADKLGDVYLNARKDIPFKGTGSVVGHGSMRNPTTGQPLPAVKILRAGGYPILLDHLIDPDTGAVGRVGRVVTASYRPDTDTGTFEIDNTRTDFDSLLARVGVQVGQVRV